MFNAILCTSIAMLGLGTEVKDSESAQPDWKETVAALNQQVADLQKQKQDLVAEKEKFVAALNAEKKRAIAVEALAKHAFAELNDEKKLVIAVEAEVKDVLAKRQELERNRLELDRKLASAVDERKVIQATRDQLSVLKSALERMRADELNRTPQKPVVGNEPSPACKAFLRNLAQAVHNKRYDLALALVDDAKAKGIKSDDVDPEVLGLAILVLSGKPTDRAAVLANKILAKTLDKATNAPEGSVRKTDAATDSSDPFGGAGVTKPDVPKPDMPKPDATKPADAGNPFGP